MRSLRALINGHPLLTFVPVGDDRARLVGHAGVTAEAERGLDHGVGFRERRVDSADVELALEAEIVTERGVNHRCLAVERDLRVGDRGKLFVIHFDQLAGILGLGAGVRDHRADSFTLPARALDGDRACGADFRPFRWVSTPTHGVMTFASSAPVTTAMTPGDFFAASVAILTMRA